MLSNKGVAPRSSRQPSYGNRSTALGHEHDRLRSTLSRGAARDAPAAGHRQSSLAHDTHRPPRAPARGAAPSRGARDATRSYDRRAESLHSSPRSVENDYSAYDSYRPPSDPTDDYIEKMLRYTGVHCQALSGAGRVIKERDVVKRYTAFEEERRRAMLQNEKAKPEGRLGQLTNMVKKTLNSII